MKRQFWMNLIDYQVDEARRKRVRASIVSNPLTGLPLHFEPTSPSLPAGIVAQASLLPGAAN